MTATRTIELEFNDQYGIFTHVGELKDQDLSVCRDIFDSDEYFTVLLPTVGVGEIVVDVGSHIGTFARKWQMKNPLCRISCVEVCPENWPILEANVGGFAENICKAACTYETGKIKLYNSIQQQGGSATGGSAIVNEHGEGQCYDHRYWEDDRPIERITLEQIMEQMKSDHIDVLKLDCEGSEFSILSGTPSLGKIGMIIGEWHGRERFNKLLAERFTATEWDTGIMHVNNDLGIFHLRNRKYWDENWQRKAAGEQA